MNYFSSDAVRVGDSVECADGMTGKVTLVATSGFCITKTDGTVAPYQSADPSVKLVSRSYKMPLPSSKKSLQNVVGLLESLSLAMATKQFALVTMSLTLDWAQRNGRKDDQEALEKVIELTEKEPKLKTAVLKAKAMLA